jgi:glycosyltransferase involved in cell wall biosynthesis
MLTIDLSSVTPATGGVAVVAAGVSRGLSELKVDHRCLVSHNSEAAWRVCLRESNRAVIDVVPSIMAWDSNWQSTMRKLVPKRARPARLLASIRDVRARSVERYLADVVWQPFHRAPVTSSTSVVTVHDLRVFEPPWTSAVDREIVSANVAKASAIVCSWRHPFAHLLELFPEVAGRAFRVPLPAMNSGTFVVRNPRRSGVRLIYPGSLTPHKNHATLLQAMSRMPEAVLTCTGPEEPRHAAHLRKLAQRLGVADRIHWRGFLRLDELEREYARADILVIPSRWEAASGPILESVSRGLPCVVCRTPPILAQLEELGLISPTFDWDDPDGLAAGVQAVLADYENHVSRLRGPAATLAQRTWTTTAAEYARIFAWVAGDADRPDHLME